MANTYEWMWKDAGFNHPVGSWLAKNNPVRWSNAMEGNEAIENIQDAIDKNKGKQRAISLRCHYIDPSTGATNHINDEENFANSEEAISYIRQLEEINRDQEQEINLTSDGDTISLGFLFMTARILAVPQLAAFCRMHSEKPWSEKNSFKAFNYAQAVIRCVKLVTKQQKQNNFETGSFIDWSHFYHPTSLEHNNNRSPYYYVDFISKGCPLDGSSTSRPATMKVKNSYTECDDESISDIYCILELSKVNEKVVKNDFWSIYEQNDGDSIIVAFRGGSGLADDGINHYGSPARAFIKYDDTIPKDIQNLSLVLKEMISTKSINISLVGYSQGGIPAIVTYLLLKEMLQDFEGTDQRIQCITYNPASVFWPRYLYDPTTSRGLLEKNWRKEGMKSYNIKNYLIQNDPLSESVPGKPIPRYIAPRFPGESFILPQRSSNILHNHKLVWFTEWQK